MRGEPANGAILSLCTIPAGVKKEAATLVGLGSQRVASVGAERRRRMEKEFFFCTWCGRERRGKKKTTDRRDGAHCPSDVEGREEGAKK